MLDPRTPVAGRYAFAGALKNSQSAERWVGVESETGRRVVLAVVDAGLRRLRDNGVNGCVIDWTSIVDFYGKFGFEPYRQLFRFKFADVFFVENVNNPYCIE